MRVLVVPGAAVRRYVRPTAETLSAAGVETCLCGAPGEPGRPADLRDYGAQLARRIDESAAPLDLLVGLSVGAQAAAVAAAAVRTGRLRQLMLISPTVDPGARNAARLLGRWLISGRHEPPRLLVEQLPDWWRAGPARLVELVRSALTVNIGDFLGQVDAAITVVHAERDAITSHAYAAQLAAAHRARLVVIPGATHSWPYGDGERFAEVVMAALE